jgi:hypothetical protein
MECDGLSVTADNAVAPVDIIWIIDSSGSMENDARTVQTNLDAFATYIAGAGIDFHLVVVSDMGFVTPSTRFMTEPERFRWVNWDVDSSKVFESALGQFPMYSAFLRADATTHMVGVTDDEDDISSGSFIPMMTALIGHPFTFHAIAGTAGPFPGVACTRGFVPAAAVGDEYFAAARATGGLEFSICTEDWTGLFATLAMTVAVSTTIPCVFELPPPPAGMSFDPTLVNVEHTPDGGATTTFRGAGSEGGCGGEQAWYYDDPAMPTQIRLCPAACTAVTTMGGRVDVRLGCATLLI